MEHIQHHHQDHHQHRRGGSRRGRRGPRAPQSAPPAPPAPTLPPQNFLPPPVDSSDEDEDAAFKREAAQLAERAQRQQLPPGLTHSQMQSAINRLRSHGVEAAMAEDALMATIEQFANGDEWLDAALMWLALQQEDKLEADKMKQAMEESLHEQAVLREVQAAAAPPLTNLSEERLRRRFAGSAVLAGLDPLLPGRLLFSDTPPLQQQVKFKLVELLRLEEDCVKWWPGEGTTRHFQAFARRVAQELDSTRSSCSQISSHPDTSTPPQQQLLQPAGNLTTTGGQQQEHVQEQQQRELSPSPLLQQLGCQHAQQQQQQQQQLRLSVSNEQQTGASADGPRRCSTEPLSPGPAPGEVGEAGGLKRSERKRTLPSRYRSPTPEPKTRRKTPENMQPVSKCASAAAAGCSSHCSSVPVQEAAKEGQTSHAAAAGAGRGVFDDRPPVVPGQPLQQQQQQQQEQQQLADSTSGYRPGLIQQLSQLLEAENKELRAAAYSMPETAGAVPDIFRLQVQAVLEDPGSDLEVEVVHEVDAAAAVAAAGTAGAGTAAALA